MFRNKIELTVSLFLLAILACALWETRAWPAQSRFFPLSIEITVLCLLLLHLGTAVKNMFRSKPAPQGGVFGGNEQRSEAGQNVVRRRTVVIQCWIVFFFLGIWLLGFKVGALVLTFAFLRLAAHESWRLSAAFAVMSYLFFLVVFDFALHVPLGAGRIADYFELNSLDMYLVGPIVSALRRMAGA